MPYSNTKGVIIFAIILAIGLGVTYMAGLNGTQFGPVSVFFLCGLWAFAINWLGFIPAAIKKTEKFYDLVGAFTNLTTVLLAAALSQPLSLRSLLVTLFVSIWALRLGSFLFKRISTDGGDRRFDEIKIYPLRFLNAWQLQGLWIILTTACAVAIITSGTQAPLDVFAYIGIALWLVGFAIEVVADNQKKAFRANPNNKGKFIHNGLWSWSRHPNYFGEIVLWVGIAVMALPVLSGWSWIALISPVFVILLLTKVSGIPLLEKNADKKWGGQEDYEAYKARTHVLLLVPPTTA